MKKILRQSVLALIGLALIIGATPVVQTLAATVSFRVVQTPTTHLYAGIAGSATSMRITPYPKDLDGNKLSITDMGSSTTVTVDPKISGVEEIIGFTGMTDNGDNTATLTGLTRDLLAKYPYTTAGVGRPHGAGATVVFSNNPQIYGRLAAKENDESIGGNWTFGGLNTFTGTTTLLADCNSLSTNTQVCAKGYIDALVVAGASNANDTTKGIVETATAAEAAAGTNLGSTGARLALGANIATSTCQSAANSVLVASSTTGKLDGRCLDTASNAYSWTQPQTFGKLTTTATTTITANSTTTSPVVLNSLPYAFPSANGASSSVLTTDGNGTLTWTPPTGRRYSLVTANQFGSAPGGGTAYATSTKVLAIPAGVMTASSTWTATANIDTCTTNSGDCVIYLRTNSGTTLATCDFGSNSISANVGTITFVGSNQSSISSQITLIQGWIAGAGTAGPKVCNGANTTSIDMSGGTSFVFVVAATNATAVTSLTGYSIIVTP